jgi:ABC-type dipeptide/oligopeptide/nickel transport system ATPase subunit
MAFGIHIFGASGSGDTTLGQAAMATEKETAQCPR